MMVNAAAADRIAGYDAGLLDASHDKPMMRVPNRTGDEHRATV